MSSRVSLLALGLGAYLAFAIVSFPASIAHRWFSPDSLALAGVEGTIWNGRAAYGGIEGLAFSDLSWQLHPAALLTGRLGLDVETRLADGFVRTGVSVSGGGVRFRDLAATTRLEALGSLTPLVGVSGNLSLSLDRLELVDGWPQAASGTVRIAGLSAPPLIPVTGVASVALGNYLARLTTTDDGIAAIVNDEGGPLELEGRVDLAGDRSYVLTSRIRPRADASDELVEGLRFMAPADAEGWHSLPLNGVL
jgi:general secretion pathway protein N